MMISQFSKATGLSADTIRFYIAKGLLTPQRSGKGGSNPYQLFGPDDVTAARMIRLQQFLGYSLREIAALNEEYLSGAGSDARTAEVLRQQIERLTERRSAIDSALEFLTGKLAWIEAGKPGDAPPLKDYIC
ncbi:MerR family transcriptional regulator [Sphingobium sp. AP49]|uniref:MerR family transcriptional regulator n=1 Tax=Sphingobium sp. AP49 TaxID=1144307 RepID=UPI0005630A95|nr:MerR family transcriptional regulator [Sphingobium sp. AP49]WHO40091.1 MerR family transcriptional regulator [Sphingobium sp. AP49]